MYQQFKAASPFMIHRDRCDRRHVYTLVGITIEGIVAWRVYHIDTNPRVVTDDIRKNIPHFMPSLAPNLALLNRTGVMLGKKATNIITAVMREEPSIPVALLSRANWDDFVPLINLLRQTTTSTSVQVKQKMEPWMPEEWSYRPDIIKFIIVLSYIIIVFFFYSIDRTIKNRK